MTKFHQLAVGQRFRLDGITYIKTGPMIASDGDTGGQKFMARSALVEVIDQTPAPHLRASQTINPEQTRRALQLYHARCLQCLERARPHLDAKLLEMLMNELDAAKRDCLSTLLEN